MREQSRNKENEVLKVNASTIKEKNEFSDRDKSGLGEYWFNSIAKKGLYKEVGFKLEHKNISEIFLRSEVKNIAKRRICMHKVKWVGKNSACSKNWKEAGVVCQ